MTILSDRIEARSRKDRPTTSITIRMPVGAIDTMKANAPIKGLIGDQSLLKSCFSEDLRWDEAQYLDNTEARLIEALKPRAVPDDVLGDAAHEQHPV